MIQVLFPNNWQAERCYSASVMLEEWLGLSVEFQFGETPFAVEIRLENGNRLLLEDHFFHRFGEDQSAIEVLTGQCYLHPENLPGAPVYLSKKENQFLPEADLPLIFGSQKLEISNLEITCGADIFASAFFMLTRWEEYVLPNRDVHDRFPAHASLAGKFSFLHRPIINEYLEMLWNMLVHLGIGHERKSRQFEFMLTCDVDMALLWRNPFFFLKKLGGDLFKRWDIREAIFDMNSFFRTHFLGERDPFDTFDYLMDCAERQDLKVHFFFLCGGNSKFDQALPLESNFIRRLLEKIKSRGHFVGIHPSYHAGAVSVSRPVNTSSANRSALSAEAIFQEEKARLEIATGLSVHTGRQHFLRFEAPATWQMWENNGMAWDSTLYYPEQPGFRCGTCYPYPVFNFLTRHKLHLLEIPLTAMEVSWVVYKQSLPEEMLAELNALAVSVQKYEGCFVLLWHNSSFNTPEYFQYQPVFEQFMEEMKNLE